METEEELIRVEAEVQERELDSTILYLIFCHCAVISRVKSSEGDST